MFLLKTFKKITCQFFFGQILGEKRLAVPSELQYLKDLSQAGQEDPSNFLPELKYPCKLPNI